MAESHDIDIPPPALPLPRGKNKPTRTRLRARLKRYIFFLVILPLLITTVLFWVGTKVLSPEQMKYRAQALLADRLSTGFSLGDVNWRWPSHIEVSNLVIHSPPGSRYAELIRIPRLSIRLDPWSLVLGEVLLERVEITGSNLVLERDHLGDLTILDVLRDATAPIQGPQLPDTSLATSTPSLTPPELIITDLRVDTCPATVAHSPGGLHVSSLRLEVSPDDPDLWVLDGVAFDSSVQSIRLDGGGRLSLGDFELALEVDQIQLNQTLRERIPPALRLLWDRYQPSGMASVSHELVLRDAQPVKNATFLTIQNGSIHLAEPDLVIDQLSGKLEITPDAISFRDPLKGNILGSNAWLLGEIELDALTPGRSDLVLKIEDLAFEPRVRSILPPALQKTWDSYSPSGRFGLQVAAGGETFPPVLDELLLTLSGADASSSHYPYPLRNLVGKIRFFGDSIELDISGGASGEPIRFRGSLETIPGGRRHLVIEGKSLPLDDRIRTALGDRYSPIFDTYSPTGRSDVRIELEKLSLKDPLDLTILMEPQGASFAHEVFPYRIDELRGQIIIEASRGRVLLQGLTGKHGQSDLSLPAGVVEFSNGKTTRLEIPIECAHLVPDDELISALPEGVEKRLRSLDILAGGGSLDTVVELRIDEETPFDIYVRARVQDPIRLRYHKLPYPLTFHQGQVVFSSTEGRIRLDELRTDPNISPVVMVSGEIGPDDSIETTGSQEQSTLLAMNFDIQKGPDERGLDLSQQELVNNLPPDLKNFFERMKLTGEVSGQASVLYRHQESDLDGPIEIVKYDVEGELNNSGFDFALRAEELSARFEIHGGIEPGQRHTFAGQLTEGDFRFSRFRASVPPARSLHFTYGVDHPRLQLQDPLDEKFPSPWLLNQMPLDRSQVFQAELGPSEIYGGPLDGFFFADLSPGEGRFAGETRVERVDLSLGSQMLFRKQGVKGIAEGAARVHGIVGSTDSILGNGAFSIRDGNLAQIPIIAGVLLNPFEGLNRRNNRIKKADCEFSIHDQLFEFKGMGSIRLSSPAGKILGKGIVGFDKRLSLIMEPQTLGGAPVLSDIANRLLRFQIGGSLDEPDVGSRRRTDPDNKE
ncbi:MAG: AsmA family protein [Planctomycetota bacterium]|nr:AsmA family protein [Planctomycetota bacterium]